MSHTSEGFSLWHSDEEPDPIADDALEERGYGPDVSKDSESNVNRMLESDSSITAAACVQGNFPGPQHETLKLSSFLSDEDEEDDYQSLYILERRHRKSLESAVASLKEEIIGLKAQLRAARAVGGTESMPIAGTAYGSQATNDMQATINTESSAAEKERAESWSKMAREEKDRRRRLQAKRSKPTASGKGFGRAVGRSVAADRNVLNDRNDRGGGDFNFIPPTDDRDKNVSAELLADGDSSERIAAVSASVTDERGLLSQEDSIAGVSEVERAVGIGTGVDAPRRMISGERYTRKEASLFDEDESECEGECDRDAEAYGLGGRGNHRTDGPRINSSLRIAGSSQNQLPPCSSGGRSHASLWSDDSEGEGVIETETNGKSIRAGCAQGANEDDGESSPRETGNDCFKSKNSADIVTAEGEKDNVRSAGTADRWEQLAAEERERKVLMRQLHLTRQRANPSFGGTAGTAADKESSAASMVFGNGDGDGGGVTGTGNVDGDGEGEGRGKGMSGGGLSGVERRSSRRTVPARKVRPLRKSAASASKGAAAGVVVVGPGGRVGGGSGCRVLPVGGKTDHAAAASAISLTQPQKQFDGHELSNTNVNSSNGGGRSSRAVQDADWDSEGDRENCGGADSGWDSNGSGSGSEGGWSSGKEKVRAQSRPNIRHSSSSTPDAHQNDIQKQLPAQRRQQDQAQCQNGEEGEDEKERRIDEQLLQWVRGKGLPQLLLSVSSVYHSPEALPDVSLLLSDPTDPSAVRKAYMKIIRQCHPDKHAQLPARSREYLQTAKIFTILCDSYRIYKEHFEL